MVVVKEEHQVEDTQLLLGVYPLKERKQEEIKKLMFL
jgi:hypothetical protein